MKKTPRNIAAIFVALAGALPASAESQPEITMAINQSPWLNSFVAMVDLYEAETGNVVVLDVNPFGGLLEKIRNSVRSTEGTYDLVAVNSLWLSEIYSGGFLAPLGDIRAGYALQDGILTYGATTNWDPAVGSFSPDGTLMGVPVNGNVQVLYYNQAIYDDLGLSVPATWEELYSNAMAIADGTDSYGFVPRAARDSIVYNFTPYLFSHDAAFFRVTGPGQAEIGLNTAEGLAALNAYLRMSGEDVAPPNPGAIAQGELIQLLSTGRAAQAIAVIAAWGALENPNESRVAGQMSAALIPAGPGGTHASSAGHWVAGIPNNVPAERQAAALAFLDWFQSQELQVNYVEAGGVPVRGDLADTDLGANNAYRFLDAYSANAENAVMGLPFAAAAEASDAMALHFNRAVIGEESAEIALNSAAEALAGVLERNGFAVTRQPDL
ncbi:ABC transporter substrate-binding protein [Alterinioella nitratireducens]|uniref:ABC transporter substrate-binding protein n=1 Tax=Alterinioella nitratireducens TaxID=2735915 RepID=UPI001555F325|nr:extracellular solute-binding protein [Alterinioella nitratireducens]NPD21605.1 extracellular solute-binding protein [Alterinioella nitratireducens]